LASLLKGELILPSGRAATDNNRMGDASMENCTISSDNATMDYIPSDDDDDRSSDYGSYYFPSLPYTHDIKLIAITILATMLAMMAYNYYLDFQVSSAKNKKRVSKNNNDPFDMKCVSKQRFGGISSNSIAAGLARIAGVQASGNFLTAVIQQMWEHMSIAVSNSIKEVLEPNLKDMKVPLHFIKLDLGNVPIEFTNMFIHRVDLDGMGGIDDSINDANNGLSSSKGKEAGIQIDVDVGWNGNCDIMLQATITRGAKVTFGVKSIKLSGRMHILLSPLTTELPVISAIQYGFTNPPDIQLEFTGAVQSVTSKLSFVQSALVNVIQSSLASMIVLPNRMVMPMDLGTFDYFDTYQPPVGMVRICAENGRGFKVLRKIFLHDIPDIYCVITLGASNTFRDPFRTSTQYDNLEPSWEGETCDFILHDMDQKVYVQVFDEDKGPLDPDDELGKVEITVRDLFQNEGRCELELKMEDENTGCYITLSADLFHLAEEVQSLKSMEYNEKNQLCGLATIIVTKAFQVPVPKVDAATHVKVVYGEGCSHKREFYTGTVADYPGVDALNPMYNSVFHVPITSAMIHGYRKDMGGLRGISAKNMALAAKKLKPSFTSSATSPSKLLDNSDCSDNYDRKGVSKMPSIRRKSQSQVAANDITFTLVDTDGANGSSGHGDLGTMTVTHNELLMAYKHTITATRAIGDGGAQLEVRVILSGMQSEDKKLQQAALQRAATGNARIAQAVEDPFAPSRPSSIYTSLYSGLDDGMTVRVTCMRGRGFGIMKRRLGKKDDVPDIYCVIRRNSNMAEGSDPSQLSPTCWKTSTVKDDTMPLWNESKDFQNVDPARDVINVDVFDQNSNRKDDYLGSAEYNLEKLLRKRTLRIELRNGSTMTKSYITLMCIQLLKTEESKTEGSAVVDKKNIDLTPINGIGGTIDETEGGDIVTPLVSVSAPPSSRPSRPSPVGALSPTSDDEDDNISVSSTISTSSRMASSMGKFKKRLSIRKKMKKKKGE